MTYSLTQEDQLIGQDHLSALVALAEQRLSDQPEWIAATFVIRDEEGGFVTSRSSRRIEGVFFKQAWGGRKNDLALLVSEETFDATDAVLSLSYQDFQLLQDGDESTDEIGRAYIDWNGPCEVRLVDAICEYFGVESLKSVSEAAFEDIKAFARPEAAFQETLTLTLKVKVDRTSSACIDDFMNNMEIQLRSMTPGVIVRETETIEACQEGIEVLPSRSMRF